MLYLFGLIAVILIIYAIFWVINDNKKSKGIVLSQEDKKRIFYSSIINIIIGIILITFFFWFPKIVECEAGVTSIVCGLAWSFGLLLPPLGLVLLINGIYKFFKSRK